MKSTKVTTEVAQPVSQTEQEIEEVASLAEDLATKEFELVGLEGIPSEVILQKGCYDTDCSGGCG